MSIRQTSITREDVESDVILLIEVCPAFIIDYSNYLLGCFGTPQLEGCLSQRPIGAERSLSSSELRGDKQLGNCEMYVTLSPTGPKSILYPDFNRLFLLLIKIELLSIELQSWQGLRMR